MTIDDVTQQHYELYAIWCDDRGLKPTIKDFTVWLDERYGE